MPPDETDEEREEKLEEDNSRPADPADDTSDDTGTVQDDTHPATDTDVEQEEIYDEGQYGTHGFSEPHDNGGTVTGYDPTKDQRRQQ